MLSPARDVAWRVLVRVGDDGRLDDSLAGLPEFERLSVRDRALANELVAGTVKRRRSLDAVLGSYTKAPLEKTDPAVLHALRLAAFQILFLDRVPVHAAVDDAVALLAPLSARVQGFANAVLRKVAARGAATFTELAAGSGSKAWGVRHSCPGWLVRLLREELGDAAAERFLVAANAAPERCLRVNTLRGTVTETTERLSASGYETTAVADIPEALLYEGPALERSAPFRAGLVTPQSRGSQLAGRVVCEGAGGDAGMSPRSPRLLDLCAAPGTKTSQMAAALPRGSITSVDIDEARLGQLGANLTRLGVEGVELVRADALELPPAYDEAFDAVLLDAPCSGLGTLASRPDLRWRRHASDIGRLADLQRRLIDRAARCVRPGGTLTYAVCTLPRAETVDVVRSLLEVGGWTLDDLGADRAHQRHPGLPEGLVALPPDDGSTGFFIARLRRHAAG